MPAYPWLILERPKLCSALQTQPFWCCVQHKDHLPQPANNAAMAFSAKNMLLFIISDVWLADWHQSALTGLFLPSCCQACQSLACADAESYFSQVQDTAFSWVELHMLLVRPSLQLVWVPLKLPGLLATPSCSGPSRKLADNVIYSMSLIRCQTLLVPAIINTWWFCASQT